MGSTSNNLSVCKKKVAFTKRSGSCFPREAAHFGHQFAAWQRVQDFAILLQNVSEADLLSFLEQQAILCSSPSESRH